MGKITTWKDIFDFSKPTDINKAIKALSNLDKVYEDLIATTKAGSKQITANNAALVKSLDKVALSSEKLSAANKNEQKEIQETNAQAKALAATYKAQTKQVIALEAQVKKLSKEREAVSAGATKAIKLQDQLNDLNKKGAKDEAALKLAIQEKRKALKAEAQVAAGRVTLYQKESATLIKLRSNLKDLILQEKGATVEGKRLAAQVAQLDSRLKGADAAVGQFQRNVGGYTQALGRLKVGFSQVAGALGFTGLIFGVAAAFRDAFGIIREFDKELTNMAAIAGETRKDLSGLEREIRRVAKTSINTAVEVAKTATALFALGQSKRQINDLLEPVNNLSIALQAPAEEAGELLIQTLNAFGKSSDSAQEYADVIAKMRTSTALDFERIKDALGFVAPTAKALGRTFAQTGADIGVLVDNGIKASRAGRLLSSSFANLNSAGITLDEALLRINESTNKAKTATQLFGTQSFTLGLILADNIDKTNEYTKAFENAGGSLKELTDKQLSSLDSQLKILDSEYTELILSIGNGEGIIGSATKSFVGLSISIIGAVKAVGDLLATPDPFKEGVIQAEELSKAIGFVLPKAISDYEKQLKSAREEAEKMSIARSEGEKNIFALRAMKDEVLRLEGGLSVLNKSLADEADKLAKLEANARAAADALAAAEKAARELASLPEEFDGDLLNDIMGDLNLEQLEKDLKKAESLIIDFDKIAKEVKDSEADEDAKRREDELKALEKHEDKKALITNTAFETASILGNQKFENDSIRRDNEIAALQVQKDRELEIAGDNEQKKAAIEAKFAEKERQIRIKQAKAEKKQAIFNIALSTAQAIIGFLATAPSPAAIPLSIAAGITGAVQLAAVASQPLPAFEDGGTVTTDGAIITSEKGYEYAVTPKGELIKTGSNGAEIRSDIPKGSHIFNHAMSKQLDSGAFDKRTTHDESNNSIQEYIKRDKIQTAQIIAHTLKVENDHLVKSFDKAIKGLPEVHQFKFSHGRLVRDVSQGRTTRKNWNSKNND